MHTGFLAAAAILGFITFCVHTFVGGKSVARPLLADTHLPIASKWLNYMCWHMATLMLLATTAGLAFASTAPDERALVLLLTVLSAACSVWSAVVGLRAGINPFRLPSTSLLAGIAVLAGLGLVA